MKKLSILPKPNRIYIKEGDLTNINELMNNGFSVQQALFLLRNNFNKIVFELIENRLKQGEEIGLIFSAYLPEHLKGYFNSFASFLSFKVSLSLTLALNKKNRDIKNEYIKNLLYPSLVFLITVFGIYFFTLVCFPILIDMMKEFNADISLSLSIQSIFMLFINILFGIFLVLLSVCLIFINKRYQVKGYKAISKLKMAGIIKLFITNEFALFFKECSGLGCSTKESIEILKSFKDKPLITFMAKKIEEALNKGASMEKAFCSVYIDKSFYNFLKISVYTSNTEEMLEGYIKVNDVKIKNFFKRLMYFIKIFSYASIALILVFVYQVLLLPLSVLSNL